MDQVSFCLTNPPPHTHTHAYTLCFIFYPSSQTSSGKKQWNIAFFLRGKLSHNISTSAWAVVNFLRNACKMFTEFFCLSPPVWDCGSTGICLFVFPCQTSQATDKLNWLKQNSALLPVRSISVAPKNKEIKKNKVKMWVQLTKIWLLNVYKFTSIIKVTQLRYLGPLAWDSSCACILKYACCVQLHQFACFIVLIWFIF